MSTVIASDRTFASLSRPVVSSILEQPHVHFGREICGDLESGLRREWLVTNGIGGYASATLPGVPTRSYHGLLVAALEPPVARMVLVAGSADWVTYDGKRYPLSSFEFESGSVSPDGYRYLESFRLEGALPVWTFAIADALIERRLWMPNGVNSTYVTYRLLRGSLACDLEITPLVTYHTFHALASGDNWEIGVDASERSATIRHSTAPFRSTCTRIAPRLRCPGAWWWDFRHHAESMRGLSDHGDLYAIGTFQARLQPGESVALLYTTEADAALDAKGSLRATHERQRQLVATAGVTEADPIAQQLVLAADQFLVARPQKDNPAGRSVIAGYHWFNDWGRDTMISLPGLALSTGRADEAASILRTFARYIADGLLPNNFPDNAGVVPGYNTADATLWFVLAIRAYEQATSDETVATDLLPALVQIVDRHIAGTRYGIGLDPGDALLRAGEPGVQLTWMDAKVGDWVVTPRIGKPVEINALWYNALRIVSQFLNARGDREIARRYSKLADRTRVSFRARFRGQGHSYLADVVDGPAGDDWTLRPSQVFALSLPFPLLDGDEAREVLDAVGRSLLTSYGLRSLSPDDPAYRRDYGGDQVRRRSFLSPRAVLELVARPVCRSDISFDRRPRCSQALLRPIGDHLRDAGLGSVSEIFEGDPSASAQRVHCPGLGRCGSTEGLANARPGKATNGSILIGSQYSSSRSMAKGTSSLGHCLAISIMAQDARRARANCSPRFRPFVLQLTVSWATARAGLAGRVVVQRGLDLDRRHPCDPTPRNVEQLEMTDSLRQRRINYEVIAHWLESQHGPNQEQRRTR